jgi:lantibiotic modifying enzyme
VGTLTAVDVDRLRDAAGRAADVLVANAITAGGRATWLGATVDWVDGDVGVVHRTGDATLYDGSAGVALAAWAVAAALGREDVAEVAIAGARHAVSAGDRLAGAGLFDGLAGVGLAAVEVGTAAGDRTLVDDGLDVLAAVAGTTTEESDVVSGSAGVVLALLAAACRTGSSRLLTAAVHEGEHLLATARRHPWGWGWPSGDGDGPDLCGLAHGAAGVAWALGELAAAVGDERFRSGVAGACRYERSWFEPTSNSWPDLRLDVPPPGSPPPRPALWCHGAAGIGLTRLALFALDGHPSMAAEAAAALQASSAAAADSLRLGDVPHGLTICHGLGGTVLLLLAAHAVLGEPEHLGAARWVCERALDHLPVDPAEWPSGVRGGGFSPGLMTGLAGVVYVLARAADPSGVGPVPGVGG